MSVTKSRHLCSGVFLFVGLALCSEAWTAEWKCETLPPERETIIEPESGAEITFLTDSPAYDQNLYFHQRSWLPDGSLILFHSDRTGRRELFGYLEKTGELIRLQRPDDSTLRRCSTASRHNNIVYVMRDLTVYAWAIGIEHGNAQLR